ncbi:rhodanese-like domain-containing protein [Nitratifractor sp.]
MKKFFALILGLSLAIHAKFRSIDADTLVKMQKAGVPVIDIRTPGEWKERGVIKGAHLMMFFDEQGRPHIEEWMKKLKQLVQSKDAPFIIYCAHANRSKALGKWLSDKVGYRKVYELGGGIEYGWKDVGKQVAGSR